MQVRRETSRLPLAHPKGALSTEARTICFEVWGVLEAFYMENRIMCVTERTFN